MKKNVKSISKLVCLLLLIFSVFGIISAYAGEPIFKITEISVKSKSSGTIVNDVDLDSDSITNNITFTDKDDYITYDITLKNTSNDNYTIKSITDDNTSVYLKYEYDNLTNVVLNANEEKKFDLTITYIKISSDPTLSNNKVNLIITYEIENGEEEQEQITPPIDGDIDNNNNKSNDNSGSPKTSDNVIIYFIIGSLSLTGLIVLSKKKKKTKLTVIALAMFIPVCVKANTLKLTIQFNNTIKAVSYNVTINSNNGSTDVIVPISKNGKLTKPSNPSKNGYNFDNWYLEGTNNVYDFDTPVTGPVSIEARYTLATYNITYNLDGGSVQITNPTNYSIESGNITLNNPTKQGFDFAGWTGTGLSSPTMTVTIPTGSTGIRTYTATYIPRNDTAYTVYHKYKDLNASTYSDVYTENKTGTTGDTVTLNYREKTGFVNPTTQKSLTILPDGSASEEYLYNRALYKVNITTDSSYVTSNITIGNDYEYQTPVTLTANKEGYNFVKWSNGETQNPYTFTLEENKSLYPTFTPRNDTNYTINHRYMNLDGSTFTNVPVVKQGTTGDTVTLDFRPEEGFINPIVQKQLTITGDGLASEDYYYIRVLYDVTLDPNNGENIISQNVLYGGTITKPTPNPELVGYDFDTWYLDGTTTSYDFTTPVTDVVNLVAHYTPTNYDITCELDGGTVSVANPDNYNIESGNITLNNPTKQGFDFAGWTGTGLSSPTMTVTIPTGSTGDRTYTATYTPRNDTAYTVYHKYKDLNASTYSDVYTENKTGTTGDTVTLSYREKEGFINPTPQKTLTILPDGSANEEYLYNRALYKVNITTDSSYVTSNITIGNDYEYQTPVTLTAGNKLGYTFVKWSNNVTDNPYSFDLTNNVSIYPIYSQDEYTVTFVSNGGNDIPSRTKTYDEEVGPLDEPTKSGFTFIGWFTEDEGGTQIDEHTLIKGTTTFYAHWELDVNASILCKRATELHHETCGRSDGKGCNAVGYTAEVDEIYYGSLPTSTVPVAGNAFDCDVNGDDYFDPVDERFYYLRNSNAETAVLIYYNDAINGVSGNTTPVSYESSGKNYIEPADALSNLPDQNDWINTVLIHDLVQVKTEAGATSVTYSGTTYNLPQIDYSQHAARMITIEDINAACNVTVNKTGATGMIDGCEFLLENTTFASPSSATALYPAPYVSAYWVASAVTGTNSKVYRVHGSNRTVGNVDASNSTGAAMRPVIEVPINRIDMSVPAGQVTLTFDTRGGTPEYEPRIYTQGEIVQELPTPTKSGYTFQGWFTNTNFTEEFTENTEITEDITIHAKWYLNNAVVDLNGEGYASFTDAINTIADSSLAKITLLKNTSEAVTPIVEGVNVEVDLNGFSVTNVGDAAIFVNNGGTLRVKNGTLNTTAPKQAAINCREPSFNGVTYVDNVEINGTGNRSAIYVEGGTLYLDKGSKLTATNNLRPALMNTCSACTIHIIDAEIYSPSETAVSNKSGKLFIGASDENINQSTPILRGGRYGLVSNNSVKMYDGIIEGVEAPAFNGTVTTGNNPIAYSGSVNNDRVTVSETGFNKATGTEVVSSTTYNTLYLSAQGKYSIHFDADGGTVTPSTMLINQGSAIATLPTPTKGIYHFDGWYDGNTLVSDGVIPDSNKTYVARWSYNSSTTPETYRTTNDVMKVYYNNIDSWKNDQSTFSSNMIDNFDNHNCSCSENTCSSGGTVYCDKPTGFDTGTGESVTVYLYDEVNSTKGAQVAYAKSSNGVIYNLIPGVKYYWELDSDTNVYGVVVFNSERRLIEAGNLRNVRDLGGLSVSYTEDSVTKTGTLKYGKLFRGVKLGTDSNNLTELVNLGVTEELELRSASEAGSSDVRLNQIQGKKYVQQELKHYQIDRATHSSYYNMTRGVVKKAMQDIVAGENIYFHCRIGTDRTGTLAYILEGLLGVSDEEKLQDYELSFFYGLVNRTRYYAEDPNSSVSKTQKFVYMYDLIPNNGAIYDWYMEGTDNEAADKALINSFRAKMIDYN